MNHYSITLITDEPPRAHLGGSDGDIPVISFGERYGSIFNVQLPTGDMTPTGHATWLRDLAEQVADLAIQVERAAAGSAA